MPESEVERLPFVDFNLTDAEKKLFQKVDEISEEYNKTGDEKILKKNDDLITKNIEIMHDRITELYRFIITNTICGYTSLDPEIVNHFFEQEIQSMQTNESI